MLTEGYMVKYLQQTTQWYYLCRAWTTFLRHQINSELGSLHSFFIRRLSPNCAREKYSELSETFKQQTRGTVTTQIQKPFSYHIAFNIFLLRHFLLAQQVFQAAGGVNYLAFISHISFQGHLNTTKYKGTANKVQFLQSELWICMESVDYSNILDQVGDLCYWVARTGKVKWNKTLSKQTTETGLVKENPIKSLTNLKLGKGGIFC